MVINSLSAARHEDINEGCYPFNFTPIFDIFVFVAFEFVVGAERNISLPLGLFIRPAKLMVRASL
jgi:hypothetical protein